MRRLLLLLILAASLAAAGAPAASASSSVQFSIMMDDDQLLYRGDDARDFAMRRMRDLGVDYVRVTILWNVVAHQAKFDAKGRRRKNFRPADPRTYPKGNWDPYDRLVRAGRTLGIGVFFNVTGPGPSWAMGRPPASQARYARSWKPNAKQFGKFVEAIGRRYDGSYRDENDARELLPRVSFWSVYNEPNQQGWLTPQWKGSTPWSPVLYRRLWLQARKALDRTDHESDFVLIGETAPLGSPNRNPGSPLAPKRFIREFFCVDSRNRPYRGAAARRRRCDGADLAREHRYSAWAHHPYSKELAPDERDEDRDAITMANIGELPALLDLIADQREGLPKENYTALTEFGYETDPPDRFSGVPPARQAAYINEGDHLAYKEPRVIANTQFLLRDVAGVRGVPKSDKRHWFTYQSGLFYAGGKAKPAAAAYRMPLVITRRDASGTGLWGWIRFLPLGTRTEVYLQFKPSGSRTWETVGDAVPVTNPFGFFEATRPPRPAGTWRALFVEQLSGTLISSREIPVG